MNEVPSIISTHDMVEFMQDERDQLIAALPNQLLDRDVWKILGKLALLEKFENLPSMLAAYTELERTTKARPGGR